MILKKSKMTELSRTTHLGIGAHPDDLEIMAAHGIISCFDRDDLWFGGVILTDGAGSPRSPQTQALSESEFIHARENEQLAASQLGQYSFVKCLRLSSTNLKSRDNQVPVDEIKKILLETLPSVIYLHNPFDRHDTHVAACGLSLRALWEIRDIHQPEKIYGCEVWRDLDWLPDSVKSVLDLSKHEDLQRKLISCFSSQIADAKRYDVGTMGRRQGHATFSESKSLDQISLATYALDLTPVVQSDSFDLKGFTDEILNSFLKETRRAIDQFC